MESDTSPRANRKEAQQISLVSDETSQDGGQAAGKRRHQREAGADNTDVSSSRVLSSALVMVVVPYYFRHEYYQHSLPYPPHFHLSGCGSLNATCACVLDPIASL